MPCFQWYHFIRVSEYLLSRIDPTDISEEALFRCAISRAYYGAYCSVLDYAEGYLSYKPSRDANDHSNLVTFLREKRRFRDAQMLHRLRINRNYADYELGADINKKLAEECNSDATSLVRMCRLPDHNT